MEGTYRNETILIITSLFDDIYHLQTDKKMCVMTILDVKIGSLLKK